MARSSKKTPEQPSAAAPVGTRWLSVRSRRARFNRAGLKFADHFATIISEAEIGTDRFEQLLAEAQLRCELIDEPIREKPKGSTSAAADDPPAETDPDAQSNPSTSAAPDDPPAETDPDAQSNPSASADEE